MNIKIYIFVIAIAPFFFANYAWAVELFLEPSAYIENGEKFYEIKAFLDTGEEDINALKGEMIYNEEELRFQKTKDGGSIINFWLDSPQKSSDGKIIFSGGISGGYEGSRGFLFSAVFKSVGERDVDSSEIVFRDVKIYINDGLGTEKSLDDLKDSIDFKEIELDESTPDEIPPENFSPFITQDPNLEGGKWVVITDANDAGEGIDYYEICELEKKQDLVNLLNNDLFDWSRIYNSNFHVLEDQNLGSYVYVKVVDKAGNEKIIMVEPMNKKEEEKKSFDYKTSSAIIVLIMLIFIAFFELIIIKRFRKNKK